METRKFVGKVKSGKLTRDRSMLLACRGEGGRGGGRLAAGEERDYSINNWGHKRLSDVKGEGLGF